MGGSAIFLRCPATSWELRDGIQVASVLGVEVQTRVGDIMMSKV